MFFIDSFWLGIILHTIFVGGVVFGVEKIQAILLKQVEPEAKRMADEAQKARGEYMRVNKSPELMSVEERVMHWSEWRQTILAEHNVRAIFTGFFFTVLAALIGFQGSYSFTKGQLWLLLAATISLLIQVIMALWVVRNDREAAYKYISQQDIHWTRFQLSLFDNKLHPWLKRITLTSFLLIILLVGHRAYGQMITYKVNEERTEQLQEKVSQLKIEKSEVDAKTDHLFDLAQHNSDLLQDILSQAEGGLMKTYALSQRALAEIRKLAAQQQEP